MPSDLRRAEARDRLRDGLDLARRIGAIVHRELGISSRRQLAAALASQSSLSQSSLKCCAIEVKSVAEAS